MSKIMVKVYQTMEQLYLSRGKKYVALITTTIFSIKEGPRKRVSGDSGIPFRIERTLLGCSGSPLLPKFILVFSLELFFALS
jgi:hypothetical protein